MRKFRQHLCLVLVVACGTLLGGTVVANGLFEAGVDFSELLVGIFKLLGAFRNERFEVTVGRLQRSVQPADSQVALDPCSQFLHLYRLGDKIHRATLERLDFVKLAIERGKENYRNVASLAIGFELRTDGVAVHIGHHNIEEYQIGAIFHRHHHRLTAIISGNCLVTPFLQHNLDVLRYGFGVVHDQNCLRYIIDRHNVSTRFGITLNILFTEYKFCVFLSIKKIFFYYFFCD